MAMPFQEVSLMQNRQRLAEAVLSGEATVSEAARLFGVSRPTAYLWVERARAQGVPRLCALSRRPFTFARSTPLEVEALVVAQKEARPAWGAKKVHATLWPQGEEAPVCVRTVDRILTRHQWTGKRGDPQAPVIRFEREGCNQLWQMDFKGMSSDFPFLPLSVLDDCSRFCLALRPLTSPSSESVWSALWDVFGEYGVPECILTDNGACFNSTLSLGPTPFQAKLWRLGVKTIHGRPRHPQTQGKIERFHRTLEDEHASRLHQAYLQDTKEVAVAWEELRQDYNWARPHEALLMRTPGSQYVPSLRKRPKSLLPVQIDEGMIVRKVDVTGKFYFRGQPYRGGRGLQREWVEIREGEHGYEVRYAGVLIAPLERLRV